MRNTRYALLLVTVVNVFNYMDRMALSVLAPSIKADLNLSDSELGLLIGLAFALFYALCGIPLARWADRGNRVTIIAVCLSAWSLMTALSGASRNFTQLLLARVGLGAGEAGCLPAVQSLLCDYVPIERRSGVFAINNCGFVAGMIIGLALSGWLAEGIGWRGAFVALGLPGLILAALVKLTLREPPRGAFDQVRGHAAEEDHSLLAKIGRLWRIRTYRALVAYLMTNGFIQYAMMQWWPSYYARNFGLNAASVGLYLAVAIGLGSAAGLLTGGFLADKAARTDIKRPLIIGALAVSLAMPAALATLLIASLPGSILFVGLTGFLWSIPTGSVVASAYSVALPHMRATAGMTITVMTSLFGIGLGPAVVGVLSDLLTPWFAADALRMALVAPTLLFPLLALILRAASKLLPRDLTASGAVPVSSACASPS